MNVNVDNFLENIEKLCGKTINSSIRDNAIEKLKNSIESKNENEKFGFRQLNEILLLCNERIVSKEFFIFLASGLKNDKETISFGNFQKKVYEFRKLAALQFGSFRFAFNYLSRKKDIIKEFQQWTTDSDEIIESYKHRNKPLLELKSISKNDLHRLGYLSGSDDSPEQTRLVRILGQENFETYLTYDHIDVYVATSMRKNWEYIEVNEFCTKLFEALSFKLNNVRYFDPTQNYHENSIAKGLIEGLMLKRAKATIYLVQESDTMGKDSEMASTLAQGKPVIAYVPKIEDNEIECHKKKLLSLSTNDTCFKASACIGLADDNDVEYLRNKIDFFVNKTREEVENTQEYSIFLNKIALLEQRFYDDRAKKLLCYHPLRFQIDLNTGVANGVLVARTIDSCSNLIYGVLTNSLEFTIYDPGKQTKYEEENNLDADALNFRLVEKSTQSAFRVVTQDEKLTNSFWNLYKLQEE